MVYTFGESVAGRKQEAKSVIRKKGTWFSQGTQLTLRDPRVNTARAPLVQAGRATSVPSYPHLGPGVGGQTKQNPVLGISSASSP